MGLVAYVSIVALGHLKHGSIDAMERLALTRSLLFDRSVVTREYGAIKYSALQSVLMMPPYLAGFAVSKGLFAASDKDARQAGYRFCAFLFTPVVCSLIAGLYARLLLDRGVDPRTTLTCAFTLLFATLLLPYSRLLFCEPLSALLLLVAYAAARSLERQETRPALVTLFATLGLLSLNNLAFLPVYALVGIYELVARQGRRAVVATAGAGVVFTLSAWFTYNVARYGDPLIFGYSDEGFTTPLTLGLAGLLVSPGRGLLLYSPLTIVGVVAFLATLRLVDPADRRVYGLFLLCAVANLLVFAKWHAFEGGWCWGPRFLLPFVPVLHLGLAGAAGAAHRPARGLRSLAVMVAGWSIGVNALEYLGAYGLFERDMFLDGRVPYRWSVFRPEYSPLFHSWDPARGLDRLPQFAVVLGAAGYVLLALSRRFARDVSVLARAGPVC